MDEGPGWMPDPEDADQERYWSGSQWTDRVRPVTEPRSLHLPEHVPELQRALAAATADIDAVEARLSVLFDRSGDRAASPAPPSHEIADRVDRVDHGSEVDVNGEGDIDGDADSHADTHIESELDRDTDIETHIDTDIDTDIDNGSDAVREARLADPLHDIEPIHMEFADPSEEEGDDDPFAELDAALAAEEPDEPEKVKRGLFRRHT